MELKDFKWKHRPILFSLAARDEAAFEREVRSRLDGLKERDVILLALDGQERDFPLLGLLGKAEVQLLSEKWEVPSGKTALFLVGKDGMLKREQRDSISLDDFFEAIDAMPMRQAEMRRNRENPE